MVTLFYCGWLRWCGGDRRGGRKNNLVVHYSSYVTYPYNCILFFSVKQIYGNFHNKCKPQPTCTTVLPIPCVFGQQIAKNEDSSRCTKQFYIGVFLGGKTEEFLYLQFSGKSTPHPCLFLTFKQKRNSRFISKQQWKIIWKMWIAIRHKSCNQQQPSCSTFNRQVKEATGDEQQGGFFFHYSVELSLSTYWIC